MNGIIQWTDNLESCIIYYLNLFRVTFSDVIYEFLLYAAHVMPSYATIFSHSCLIFLLVLVEKSIIVLAIDFHVIL